VKPTFTVVPSPGIFYQISFEVMQVLQFVNFSKFQEQEASNIDVFIDAMYDAVPELVIPGYDSIYVTSVVDFNDSNIVSSSSLSLWILQAPSENDAITVIYNVTVGVNQLEYGSTDDLYNDLVASISTACSGADSEFVYILRNMDKTGVYEFSTVPDEYPTTSSYVTVLLHSPVPSTVPSLSPTCGVGSYGDESGCQKCPPGTYGSSIGLDSCTKCPMNYYSNDAGSDECTECTWPFSTYETGSNKCSAVYLNIHEALLLTPIVVIVLIFLLGLWSVSSHRLAVSLILLFPTIDIVTDILYLLHTRFHDVYLFGACALFLLVSSSTFIFTLFQEKLYPRVYGYNWINWCWWIGVSNGYPTVNGVIKVTSFSNHDSLPKALYLMLCWMVFLFAQCICGIPLFILVGLYSPFYVLWLMVGALLFQMKMVAVGPVLNFWIFIWSDALAAKKKLDENHVINTRYFNLSSVNSLILETLPQLLIQIVNSSLVSNWSMIGAVSIAISGKQIHACAYYNIFFYNHNYYVRPNEYQWFMEIRVL
jgi:hypothetical protein